MIEHETRKCKDCLCRQACKYLDAMETLMNSGLLLCQCELAADCCIDYIKEEDIGGYDWRK